MNKKKSFTLIEILVSFSILIIALGGIFLILNTGESSSPLNLSRVEAASKARIVMSKIVNDLRGAYLADIANNNPSCFHIKFRKVKGVDISEGSHSYDLAVNYTEYFYDQESSKLSYSQVDADGVVLSAIEYANIDGNIFYTLDSQGSTVCLNKDDLNNQKLVIANIRAQEQNNRGGVVSASLTQRIKIRNE
ncbi:MAG: type II secretion system GspH family protein [Candidatus Omnitrophica bacterium]|nr:type II secretion system GspH family protein [Candidatus Omnitrophota bacterium]MCF7877256.1 type II secretion system GspH family protein [Candidatus Omnitrophota bacterium]MCF7877978.1 type II secretion system GspH family protein [Candidatus Omnitrophota bacterium]